MESLLWLRSDGVAEGVMPKPSPLVQMVPGLETLTQLGLLRDFSLFPCGLSTWCLQLGIFRGPGLLTQPFMAPTACVPRQREPSGDCIAFLTQPWESHSHFYYILLVRAFKRPTQTPGVMTQAPFLDGGIARFWNGHVGLKILLWPFGENMICHKIFDRY